MYTLATIVTIWRRSHTTEIVIVDPKDAVAVKERNTGQANKIGALSHTGATVVVEPYEGGPVSGVAGGRYDDEDFDRLRRLGKR